MEKLHQIKTCEIVILHRINVNGEGGCDLPHDHGFDGPGGKQEIQARQLFDRPVPSVPRSDIRTGPNMGGTVSLRPVASTAARTPP